MIFFTIYIPAAEWGIDAKEKSPQRRRTFFNLSLNMIKLTGVNIRGCLVLNSGYCAFRL